MTIEILLKHGVVKKVALQSPSEIKNATIACLRVAQRETYPNEYKVFSEGKTLSRHSYIDRLWTVYDQVWRVIRETGRTERSDAGQKEKSGKRRRIILPIILPTYHYVTKLIIQ